MLGLFLAPIGTSFWHPLARVLAPTGTKYFLVWRGWGWGAYSKIRSTVPGSATVRTVEHVAVMGDETRRVLEAERSPSSVGGALQGLGAGGGGMSERHPFPV